MKKFIILLKQNPQELKYMDIDTLEDFAACDSAGCLAMFNSEERAKSYAAQNHIEGVVMELPLFENRLLETTETESDE